MDAVDIKPYSEFALIDLLDAFASNAPVPGGGSAAALSGALGVSLLIMAASLPKSRTGAPEEAADLAEAAARLRPLRDTLVTLIDDDSDAYRAVMNGDEAAEGSSARREGGEDRCAAISAEGSDRRSARRHARGTAGAGRRRDRGAQRLPSGGERRGDGD